MVVVFCFWIQDIRPKKINMFLWGRMLQVVMMVIHLAVPFVIFEGNIKLLKGIDLCHSGRIVMDSQYWFSLHHTSWVLQLFIQRYTQRCAPDAVKALARINLPVCGNVWLSRCGISLTRWQYQFLYFEVAEFRRQPTKQCKELWFMIFWADEKNNQHNITNSNHLWKDSFTYL